MTSARCVVAVMLMTITTAAAAQTLKELSTRPATQLSLGAASLLTVLNKRGEVELGYIQTPFAFAEPNGTVWVSAWPGPRAIGQTAAEKCSFVLRALREALGVDGTGKISSNLRMNVEGIVLAGAGTASSDETTKALTDQMMVRGVLPLGAQIGTCQSKILGLDTIFTPRDDPVWNVKLQ